LSFVIRLRRRSGNHSGRAAPAVAKPHQPLTVTKNF
jgi:hypothetical protein